MVRNDADKRRDAPGVVAADSVYTLEEIQVRLKLGDAAMRQAKRKGLTVRSIGRRRYVLGRDLIAWLENGGTNERKRTGHDPA